jgi:hypothetical protein
VGTGFPRPLTADGWSAQQRAWAWFARYPRSRRNLVERIELGDRVCSEVRAQLELQASVDPAGADALAARLRELIDSAQVEAGDARVVCLGGTDEARATAQRRTKGGR